VHVACLGVPHITIDFPFFLEKLLQNLVRVSRLLATVSIGQGAERGPMPHSTSVCRQALMGGVLCFAAQPCASIFTAIRNFLSCFLASEDFEAQTDQDDNVMMKEMSDALLLEDSETEVPYYVLSEEGGQMMLEEVFQVSEYKIVLDSNDSILIEDQPDGDNWNYKLLNMDMGRFDISTIANNTSLEIESTDSSTSATDFFKRSDSAILVSRTEQIT